MDRGGDKAGKEDLDRLLAALARDERALRPDPSEALVARVLADAADVTAGVATGERPAQRRQARGWRLVWPGLGSLAWPGGAVATMVIGLILGIGIGYGYGDEAVAMTALDGIISPDLDALDDMLWAEGPF